MRSFGNFRKGKKAFKRGLSNKLASRYARHLAKIELNRRAAIKIFNSALIAAMGAAQMNMVIQTPFLIGYESRNRIAKQLQLAQIGINTAQQIAKIFAE